VLVLRRVGRVTWMARRRFPWDVPATLASTAKVTERAESPGSLRRSRCRSNSCATSLPRRFFFSYAAGSRANARGRSDRARSTTNEDLVAVFFCLADGLSPSDGTRVAGCIRASARGLRGPVCGVRCTAPEKLAAWWVCFSHTFQLSGRWPSAFGV